jgi:hypothetical protein
MADAPKPSQLDKFKELARNLEADESEERIDDQVRRIAKTPRQPEPKDK